MKRMSYSGKIGIFALVILSLVFPAAGQVSLRNALDFDGDGTADYYTWGSIDSTWYIRANSGVTFIHPFGDSSLPDFPTPGDYDGDGRGDMAVFDDIAGVWKVRQSSTGAIVTVVFGQEFDVPMARDYDGDGRTDIAVVRDPDLDNEDTTLEWRILPSDGSAEIVLEHGLDTDFFAPGDYNGDGRFDLAVYRADGGNTTFDIQFFGGGTQTIQVTGSNLDDRANPGDYDGDGITDAALTRPGPGDTILWVIRRSSDSVQEQISFGDVFEDFTVQNDYNGDGRTDLATWRISEGRFYIKDSANLGEVRVPWGVENDIAIAAYDSH